MLRGLFFFRMTQRLDKRATHGRALVKRIRPAPIHTTTLSVSTDTVSIPGLSSEIIIFPALSKDLWHAHPDRATRV